MSTPSAGGNRREPFSGIAIRAVCWLALLAPLFYSSYGFANWLAAQRADVGSIVFDWERHIPFVAWTIVPYWSINLFYGLSLLFNDSKSGVDRLAGRYLTAQVIAVACFIAFPLTATFVRPQTDGIPGYLFAVLGGFDKPFNQAPSLHIALLVIIWDHLRHRIGRPWRVLWHVWCILIGASVLTTWQHHFIDIPTGALLGLFALWLSPRNGVVPFHDARLSTDPRGRKLAIAYAAGSLACLAIASSGAFSSAVWLILLWPFVALAIVALAYATGSKLSFQKSEDGTVSMASRLLLWPYRIGARINLWAWTRRLAANVEVASGVSLGRFPSKVEANTFQTVVDLAAELERPGKVACRWISIPALDLVAPDRSTLKLAADAIEAASKAGPILVCCALGFQRSAGAVATWLVDTGRAADLDQAATMIAGKGRPVHLPASMTSIAVSA